MADPVPPFVIVGYEGPSPTANDVTLCLKKHPKATIVVARNGLVAQARRDYESHLAGNSTDSGEGLVRVRLTRTAGSPSDIEDLVANLLVGLRYQKGNVVVWIEPVA